MEYAQNASKFHKDFGDMLIEHGYGGLGIEQEVQVCSLCPSHGNRQDRFDYYIRGLNLVIELQGKQHFEAISFSSSESYNKNTEFYVRMYGDMAKEKSARDSGLLYIAWHYSEKICHETFVQYLEQEKNRVVCCTPVTNTTLGAALLESSTDNSWEDKKERMKEERKERAREYRKAMKARL